MWENEAKGELIAVVDEGNHIVGLKHKSRLMLLLRRIKLEVKEQ